MNIGVADAAEFDVDGDIVFARLAPLESIRSQRSFGTGGSVTFSFDHDGISPTTG